MQTTNIWGDVVEVSDTLIAKARKVPGLELEIHTDSDRFITAYLNDRPFVMLQRKRVYGPKDEPTWRAFDLMGVEVAHSMTARTMVVLIECEARKALARELH